MQPRDRILALDSGDQVVERRFIGNFGNDLEQSGTFAGFLAVSGIQQFPHREARLLRCNDVDDGLFRHVGLRQRVQQRGGRVIAAGGQGPRNARHGAAVRIRHGPQQMGQRFGVDELGQCFDVGDGFLLFRGRERGDDGLDGVRPQSHQLFQCFLRQRAAWIAAGFNFGDEPIGTVIGK